MTVGADSNPMLAHAVTSDSPEVTRVGKLLRDLKLMSCLNFGMFCGDMVFVGPRPIAQSLQDHLENHIPGFSTRLSIPPGLTSLGQVCIDENDSAERVVQDWSVRFEAEMHYLKTRSVTYDLVIICMTILYCLRKIWRCLTLKVKPLRVLALTILSLVTIIMLTGCAMPVISAKKGSLNPVMA